MNENKNRRKWRNFLIHPSFQLRLAAVHTLFMLEIILVLVGAVLAAFYWDVQGSGELWARYASAHLLLALLPRMAATLILIILILALYYVVFSHQLCGPLVNMGHTFRRIAQGDLTRKVFLRKRDFLKEEAASINDMLDGLSTKILALKTSCAEIVAVAQHLPESAETVRIQSLLAQHEGFMGEWAVIQPISTLRPKRSEDARDPVPEMQAACGS